jgi:hypothetical protein
VWRNKGVGGSYDNAKRKPKRRRIKQKYRNLCEVYKGFTERDPLVRNWDFSDEAIQELRQHETFGEIECKHTNGFYHGKWLSSLTVSMWREDINKKYLFKWELYDNPDFPDWWLDSVLKGL